MKKKATVTTADLAALSAQRDAAQKRYIDAKNQYDEETIVPKVKAMVGRYMVYRGNCYSCPKRPSDYWNEYAKVTSTDGYCIATTRVFVDSNGKAHMSADGFSVSFEGNLPSGWAWTTKDQYDREVRRVRKLLGI